ncbi:MAG: DUF4974 domain-containing protein [Aureispira sp.]|nr:DUF4974 domain-containing protein [Aureispira sp.]
MKDIYHLLPKYFSGECSGEESKAIEHWQKSNDSEFQDMKKIWELTEGHQYVEFDAKQGWEEISPKLQSTSRFGWLSVAASVAVIVTLVGSYFMFFNNGGTTAPEMLALTATEQQQEVQLADGSTIWLHKGSTLKYPKSFDGQSTRTIDLEGEAYFEVAKMEGKPFTIEAADVDIRVVGTAFNLKIEEAQTVLSVTEGIVECSTQQQLKEITAGNQAVLERGLITASIIDNPNYMAWKTGQFVFENTPLFMVIADLSTYYTAKLDLEDGGKFDCQINAEFDKEKIGVILELISATCGLKIETVKQGIHYIITN